MAETAVFGSRPPLHARLSAFERGMITLSVMIATLIQTIDSTVAVVALPHMQASLSATRETVTWVLTSYIVASAVAIPITGWLSERVGRKRLLVGAVIMFTLASVLCAVAAGLTEMVIFRVLQGASGAFLMPIAQAVMFDINPPEKHAKAMTIYGSVIVIGPIIGPMIGGWLTDSWGWRWVFLVNLPIGIVCTLAILRFLPEWPTNRKKFDLTGFALLALAVASIQMMLDRGEHRDWFESWEIWIELGLGLSAGWMFLVHTIGRRDSVIDPRLFHDRNFVMAMGFTISTSLIMFSGSALLPPMLQTLMGYSVWDAGLLAIPRGIGLFVSMNLFAGLINRVDPRLAITVGVALCAYSLHTMSGFSLQMDHWPVVTAGFIQGVGVGIIWMPVTMLSFATLPDDLRTAAASLTSLIRMIAGSIGVSLVTTMFARNVQTSHSDLASQITPASTPVIDPALLQTIGQSGQAITAMLDAEINRQAAMIAYIDDFHLIMITTLCSLPLAFLMGRPRRKLEDPHLPIE